MRTITCDAPDCRSTCELPSENARGYTDTKTEIERRGWVCCGQAAEQKHYCQAHRKLAQEKTDVASVSTAE